METKRNDPHSAEGLPNRTIYVAVEVSRKSWVVGIGAPDAGRITLRVIPAADVAALTGLIEHASAGVERERGARPQVLCAYEAGYEGFWLARRLAQLRIETLVLDPASLPLPRRARRIKTDRVDARSMVQALMACDRGGAPLMSAIRVPSVEEEDRRRLPRERRRLVKQRTMLTNSIRGLLMLHGVFDLHPRSKGFLDRVDAVRTGYGTKLPCGVRAEIRRAAALVEVVQSQIAEIEAERDRLVAQDGCAERPGNARAPSAMLARLTGLKGVGANDAVFLVHEVFCREFRNRRELASWAGLAPAPWASGERSRSQGVGGVGPPWVRAQLIQLAWRWLRHQPESALSRWFQERTTGKTSGRARQVFIIALARKLLVALWRYATSGVVPDGARLV